MHGSEAVPQLLTMDELAERLGVTHRYVHHLVAERRVPYLRIGRLVRFDQGETAAWLDSNVRGTAAQSGFPAELQDNACARGPKRNIATPAPRSRGPVSEATEQAGHR